MRFVDIEYILEHLEMLITGGVKWFNFFLILILKDWYALQSDLNVL